MQIKCALDLEKLIKRVKHSDTVKRTVAFLENKYRVLEREIERVSKLKQGLWGCGRFFGLITEQEYVDMKASYGQVYKELNIEIANLSKQLVDTQNQTTDNNVFISKFKAFGNITDITRDVVVSLIDEIIVHEGRQIKIKFKYQDEYRKLLSIFANE